MDQFSYIANADVVAIEALFTQYKQDPNSVDESWQNFFKGFEFSQQWSEKEAAIPAAGNQPSADHLRKEIEVVHLIRGFRSRGHLLSNTNPIGPRTDRKPMLNIADFNLTEADLDSTFEAGIEVFGRPAKLSEIVEALKKVYTSRIGFEYLYIRDRESKNWLRNKIEREYLNFQYSLDEKKRIVEKLDQAVHLENFIHTKFLGKAIRKVAVCGGAGGFLLGDAILQSADIFITADYKYHEFFDADNRIIIADIGHYESEQFTKELLKDYICKKITNFAVNLSETPTNPINYYY